MQAFNLFNIRQTNEVRVLCAAAFRIDERAFQVYAGNAASDGAGFNVLICGTESGGELLFRQSQGGRQKSGNPFREFINADLGQTFQISVREVVTAAAVAVGIDESRHQHIAADIDNFVRLGQIG